MIRAIFFAAERRGWWDVGRSKRNRRGQETAASAVYTSRRCDNVSVSAFRAGVKRVFRHPIFYYSGSARNTETFLITVTRQNTNDGFRPCPTIFSKQTPNEFDETFAHTIVVVGYLAPNDGKFLLKTRRDTGRFVYTCTLQI